MSQNVRLGLFIVLGLAVLTGGIFLIGGGRHGSRDLRHLGRNDVPGGCLGASWRTGLQIVFLNS